MDKKLQPKLRFKEFKNENLKTGKMIDFGSFYYGKSAPKHSLSPDAPTPCVRYGELYSTFNEVISSVKSYTNIEPEKLKFSKGGEVLIPRVGENPLEFANCSFLPLSNIAIGEMISVYTTQENGLFVTYYINSVLKIKLARVVEGGNVSNLYFRYLENLQLNLPTLSEQNKIVDFISSIGENIDTLEDKLKLMERYREGAMQKIFSQKIRLKDDKGEEYPEWEEVKLGDILSLTLREVAKPKTAYGALGVRSHAKGTFHKEVEDPTKVAMDKLYKVKEDDFIVSITFAWEHAVAICTSEDEGRLVSHRFPTYRAKENLDINFFRYIIKRKRFKYLLDLISPGGAGRNRVLSKPALLKLKISIPNLKEQRKIADFLSSIDEEIKVLKEEIKGNKEFKKGLLQQMFV